MFFRRVFTAFLLMFVFFGAFGLMNSNRGQEAYMQGYVAGQQSVVQGEDRANTAVSPIPPAAPTHNGFGFLKIFPLFLLCGMGLFGMMLFFGFMKAACGKHGWHEKGWHHEHHWQGWSPKGDWPTKGDKEKWYDEHGPSDEPVMKA